MSWLKKTANKLKNAGKKVVSAGLGLVDNVIGTNMQDKLNYQWNTGGYRDAVHDAERQQEELQNQINIQKNNELEQRKQLINSQRKQQRKGFSKFSNSEANSGFSLLDNNNTLGD